MCVIAHGERYVGWASPFDPPVVFKVWSAGPVGVVGEFRNGRILTILTLKRKEMENQVEQ